LNPKCVVSDTVDYRSNRVTHINSF
jgi:hypothetical protein